MKLRHLIGVAMFAAGGAAQAQSGTTIAIAPNADVRATMVSGPERRVTGQFVRMSADTLTLARHRHAVMIALPLAHVHRLEVRGSPDPWRGARWGAGILGGVALVFGGIDTARGGLETGEYVSTILGNALIGGLLGYAIAPRGWVDVPRHAVGSGAMPR